MTQYETLYNRYADNTELLPTTAKVQEAEAEFKKLQASLDSDLFFAIDEIIGTVARAYELQGFTFALSLKDKAII